MTSSSLTTFQRRRGSETAVGFIGGRQPQAPLEYDRNRREDDRACVIETADETRAAGFKGFWDTRRLITIQDTDDNV